MVHKISGNGGPGGRDLCSELHLQKTRVISQPYCNRYG